MLCEKTHEIPGGLRHSATRNGTCGAKVSAIWIPPAESIRLVSQNGMCPPVFSMEPQRFGCRTLSKVRLTTNIDGTKTGGIQLSVLASVFLRTSNQQSASDGEPASICRENLRNVLSGPQVAYSFTMRSIQLPIREPSSLGNRFWQMLDRTGCFSTT